MDKGRVETFSDGVFAIAITLLVLTIAQPSDFGRLAHQLVNRWPSLAAYVVSFTVIGIMWVNHHTIFTHLRVVNRGLFYFNLLLLMTIVFIPYPTEVFGEALSRRHGATTAAVFYSATMTINALAWASLWLYASVGRRLLNWDFPEQQRRVSTILFISGGRLLCDIDRGRIHQPLSLPGVPCCSRHLLRIRPDLSSSRSRRQPLKTHATKDDIVLAIHAAPSLFVAIDSGRPTPAPQAVSITRDRVTPDSLLQEMSLRLVQEYQPSTSTITSMLPVSLRISMVPLGLNVATARLAPTSPGTWSRSETRGEGGKFGKDGKERRRCGKHTGQIDHHRLGSAWHPGQSAHMYRASTNEGRAVALSGTSAEV